MNIISTYLARQYCQTLLNVFSISVLLLLVTSAFDVLMRYKGVDLSLDQLARLTCYKIPYLLSELSPLLCALSVLAYLIWLIQTNQLINIFNSGFSIILLVRLLALVNLALGLIVLTIVTPLGGILLGRFEDLERGINQQGHLRIYKNILIKEESFDVQRFIYIQKVDLANNLLESVTILTLKGKLFDNKLECQSAKISNEKWSLSDCQRYSNNVITIVDNVDLVTKVTFENIWYFLSPVYNVPIWQIPSIINAAKTLGSQTKMLELHYYKQIFRVLLTAMISLAPFYFFKASKAQIFKNIVDTLVIVFFMFLGVNILTNILINYINSAIMCNIIPAALCLFVTVVQIRHTYMNPI
jgi:lipopolysaccharide export LptBFGC system permease protein LptF